MIAHNKSDILVPTPNEFANIVACERCTIITSRKLLRDNMENVPQPGFVGFNYKKKRVVLAGQNPGVCSPQFAQRDAFYTAALRAVRDTPNKHTLNELNRVLLDFVPDWPVSGKYFPLEQCGLSLNDIAYFNVVRCRTQDNSIPGKYIINNCLHHFRHWVEVLQPHVVIFIGKWAFGKAGHVPNQLGIPCYFMNRDRSLSRAGRLKNRNRVSTLVRNIVG